MSEHLPECGAIDCDCTPEEECVSSCRNNCICDRLRQAEQRALGKARDAVAALSSLPDVWVMQQQALAAIDALTGGEGSNSDGT